MKTELKDYTLFWNGKIKIQPEQIVKFISKGIPAESMAVTNITSDVEQYNRIATTKILKDVVFTLEDLDHTWVIPEEYKNLNLYSYVNDKLVPNISTADDKYYERMQRLLIELELFVNNNYSDLLRTLIYIVDTLKDKNIVYGVGRGSSCASYLLYLIGIHSVDPIKYNIPLNEFFKD